MAALFWGILTFSILIVIHEGGHFVAARLFGVKVHEFMIGLPGPALRLHGKKTTYGVTAIPLGGYVRIAGMEPGPEDPLLAPALAAISRRESANPFDLASDLGIEEAAAERLLITLADWDAIEPVEGEDFTYRSRFSDAEAENPKALLDAARAVTYRALPLWKRLVVLVSGVAMNLLTAILVFTIVFSIYGYYRQTMSVDEVTEGSAAAAAGIRKGDTIKAIGDTQIGRWFQLQTQIGAHEPGDKVVITLERDGKTEQLTAVLGKNPKTGKPVLGVVSGFEYVKPSVIGALGESIANIGLVFMVIAGLFNPQTFAPTVSQSSSVIGASYMAADAARQGALAFAGLVAALSLSLGVINVFPIPPLDGGKVVLEILEKLRGRPLSRNVSLGLSVAGASVLFALIGYLMYADVVRFIIK